MLTHFVGMIVGAGISYGLHFLMGDHVGVMTDFFVTSLVGGVAYVFVVYKLKQMRGEL